MSIIFLIFHLLYCCEAIQLCPGDQIVTIGDTMRWVCQTYPSGKWLRIYNSNPQETIFNGNDVFPNGVDPERCEANQDNITGTLTFEIQNVQPNDAIKFGCRDTHNGERIEANLIILDGEPEITRKPISLDTDELKCHLKFYGPPVKVNITWLDRNGKHMDDLDHGQRVRDGIESVLNVSLEDKRSWPASCQISFELHNQCNTTIYVAQLKSLEFATIDPSESFLDVRYPGHPIVILFSLMILWDIVSVVHCCYEWRRNKRRYRVLDPFQIQIK